MLTQNEAAELREVILSSVGQAIKLAETEATRQKRRLARLETERTKLLHAHYAGAVPLDQLKQVKS